jgi:hypothetical protein
MKQEKYIYTDGRDVVVTDYNLKTRKADYQLKGITNFGLAIVKTPNVPGSIIALIGLTLLANVFYHFIPSAAFEWFSFPSITKEHLVLLGAAITVAGTAWIILTPRKYAVWIETAEGIKRVVVSKSKEYIEQILHAIRRARLSKVEN